MENEIRNISSNRIIGELISREKYSFVEGKLIASIVDDVMGILKEEGAEGESVSSSKKRKRI